MKQVHFINRFLAIIVAFSVSHYSCNEVETIQNAKRALNLEQDENFQRLVAIQLEINERVAGQMGWSSYCGNEALLKTLQLWIVGQTC